MQTVPVTGAVVVTTPEDIALEDVRKGIRMFEDNGTPLLGIVENMSGFECPSCGDHHERYGSGGGKTVASEYDLPLLAEIPMVPDIRAGNDDDGPPIALQDGAEYSFETLADAVTNRVGAVNRAEIAGVDPDNPVALHVSSDEYLEESPATDGIDDSPSVGTSDDVDGERTETTRSERDTSAASEPCDADASDDTDESDATGGLDITE